VFPAKPPKSGFTTVATSCTGGFSFGGNALGSQIGIDDYSSKANARTTLSPSYLMSCFDPLAI
jgi:hypothetical protein